MKIKKSKHIKRWINYYRIHYNFHYPYKFLIDGNFLKLCIDKEFILKEKLAKWIKGQIFFYVTSCVLQELNALPEEYKYIFYEAKKLSKLKCGHITGVSPKECFIELIGQLNENKYMVCSQDNDLRTELRYLGGVPTFHFLLDLKFDIEEPIGAIRQIKNNENIDRSMPNKEEQALIKKQKQQDFEKQKVIRKMKFQKEKEQLGILLEKKALAPNPLSMKRKLIKLNDNQPFEVQSEVADITKKRKRNRVRSRNKQE